MVPGLEFHTNIKNNKGGRVTLTSSEKKQAFKGDRSLNYTINFLSLNRNNNPNLSKMNEEKITEELKKTAISTRPNTIGKFRSSSLGETNTLNQEPYNTSGDFLNIESTFIQKKRDIKIGKLIDKDRLKSVNKLIETIQQRSKQNHSKIGYISERMRDNVEKNQSKLTARIFDKRDGNWRLKTADNLHDLFGTNATDLIKTNVLNRMNLKSNNTSSFIT